MPKNLPARIPVRANSEIVPSKAADAPPSAPPAIRTPIPWPSSDSLLAPAGFAVDRRSLALALRFLARLAAAAPIEALKGILLCEGFAAATDLDVALRVRIPGVRDVGVLVPAEPLKRLLAGSTEPSVAIARVAPTEDRPFALSVDGAILSGQDPAGFPDPERLFPDSAPRAQARFQTLEAVLAAAAVDETRKAMNAVFFQLCRNTAVATDGHRLHALEIESGDDGDFLVPRKAVELVENIRRAARVNEVRAGFFEHQAVIHVGPFDVSVRLETEKFPAWEEVVPKRSKYELRLQKKPLLEALDRIAAAMNERNRGVRLRKLPEGLEIHGKKSGSGELTTTIPASGWKEDEVLGVNLRYFHDAVRFAPSDELTIGLSDENSPIKIADGSYLALVMPIRLRRGELP
jgi:DNA polymerase III beta subunit, C-terminal domain/DNA polymerase III beta subunit, central domain